MSLNRARWLLATLLACAGAEPACAAVAMVPQIKNAAGASIPGGGSLCINSDGSSCAPGDAAASTPLTGTLSASGTAGPFVPQLGRGIAVTITGSWTGTIQLLRSRDGGVTKLPITYPDGTAKGVWTANVNAIATVETVAGATYYLAALAGFSGSAAYTVEN